MRRIPLAAALLTTALVAAPVRGQEALPRPGGYEFGKPRLLTQQLIWGLAHGVKLLAAACGAGENGGRPIASVYAEWLERQRRRIDDASRDLSQHYFGRDTADDEALTAALHLKPALDQRPDEIAAACASFVPTIATPRYDLDLFYALRRDAARVERAEAARARVAACLKKLPAESAAHLEASYAAWEQTNALFESVARSRLFNQDGDSPDERQWRRDAGSGAVPPAVACAELAGALTQPAYALRDVFEDADR